MNRKIFLISGKMRAGKNQFAEYLEQELVKNNLSYKQDMFAGSLKSGALEDFDRLNKILIEQYNILINKCPEIADDFNWMNVKDEQFFEEKTIYTRALLQIYGTDIFTKRVDADYWVKQVIQRIKEDNYTENYLITDTRFPNEIELMYEAFKNDNNTEIFPIRVERDTGISSTHPSENSLNEYDQWFAVIDNNTTLDNLRDSATEIYKLSFNINNDAKVLQEFV